jgi:hypothetical protein
MMLKGMPRAVIARTRRGFSRRKEGNPGSVPVSTAAGGSSVRSPR